MAKGNRVELVFAGDSTQLQKTFEEVGSEAQEMAKEVGSASRRMASDADDAGKDIGDTIGDQEGKFQGLASTINGTGDVMEGFKTGNVAVLAMGFADLADGLSKSVIPALQFLKTTLLTTVVPAMWAVVTHPLFIAIAAGGAIIVGLILLEKKFGVVSGAVDWLRERLSDAFNWIKNNWDDVANIITTPFLGAFRLISRAWNATVGGFGFTVPDWVPFAGGNSFVIPRMPSFSFHQGGVVPGTPGGEVMAVLQSGEEVLSASQRPGRRGGVTVIVQGSVIAERDLGRTVAEALRGYGIIGGTI